LGVEWLAVTQESTERSDHRTRPSHAVPLACELSELAEPPWRVLQVIGEVGGLVAGPVRMLLPAAAAQAFAFAGQ
jgi:hypothetical protein